MDLNTQPYWWDAAAPEPSASTLPESTAIAIVGGGYAGLSAALTLARLGHTATVIDAERIGWGASSRNGGMVSGGLKVATDTLAASYDPDRTRAIAAAAAASFPFIEDLIARENIGCDYIRCGRFLAAWSPAHYRALATRYETIAELTGLPTRMIPRANQREELGSDHYHGGMVAEATGSLHPGKYARGLANAAAAAGANLVDSTRVQSITPTPSGFQIQTTKGPIQADAVLMATNGYTRSKTEPGPMPWLARRLIPLASYIIATEPLGQDRVRALFPKFRMTADTKRVLNYFRPSPDHTRVLWGGRVSFNNATPAEAAPALAETMAKVFPELRGVRLTHAWTGNVAFTFDQLPHIGVQNGIHYAAGCQGSGVAMATWLGHNAALKIAGAANAPFALDALEFPTIPGYTGDPWFLPLVGGYYKLRDRIDRLAA